MTPETRRRFIQDLPKVELHLHLEGTLEPRMMLDLAARNGVTLRHTEEAALIAAYDFGNLQNFLNLYYEGAQVLQTEADFRDLALAYLDRVAADSVRHVEVFFDPQTHLMRGIGFDTVMRGILAGLTEGERRHGISHRLILCFLRDQPVESAEAVLDLALPWRQAIIGVGLDSAERGNPPERFAALFRRARAEGFLTFAHAGEEGPPDYVRQALDLLQVTRIDHGNRALEEPALVAHLAALQMPLTVCPLSNQRLQVHPDLRRHPLRQMLRAGLCATVNSDDPAYFGGYMTDNYLAVAEALDLTAAEILQLAVNAVRASLLAPAEKARLLLQIHAHAAEHGVAGQMS